ncbi:circularly permutated Ras protein 1-like isoform X2 [Biomphalaria glabrata]|uniref:Circularly permutated Ras protein 1-like isoform X2 n=1 Tax=Biomphalaria glabrata TaxID=6526 RepID=A0A9W2YSP9_BIOGL|nr:circularly permutated Ras protein 1-like isoform X2 [Biomphalaria glabrata]
MEFGSNFILVGGDDEDDYQAEQEEEEIDPDYNYGASHGASVGHVYGFECEIMESEDNEDDTPVTFAAEEAKKPTKTKVNTNTISLTMSSLKEPPEATILADPIRCDNPKCGAFFSDIDKCHDGEPWKCKFCGTENKPSKWPEVKVQDVLYAHDGQVPSMDISESTQTIIFVVDVSGSMGRTLQIAQMSSTLQEIVTSEHTAYLQEMSQILGMNITAEPNVRITEVSWLQAVKASIIDQLVQLKEKCLRDNKPQPKVGLITFGDIVTLYKDGWGEPIKIEGGQLADYYELLRLGTENSDLGSLSDTCRSIETCVRSLKCDGQTALGPALVVAQGMVIGSKGSKIIICTDGVSNVGIGNLDSTPPQEIATFFKNVIQRGKDSGTSISVLSFDECKMEKLGPVAEETGGIVDFIKPTQLGSRLKDELSRATIATNALIKFVVHKSMYIQVLDEAMKECSWDYFIGNIQMDKKVPFCFAPRSEDTDSAQTSDVNDPELLAHGYPFQVQIYFTDMKGNSAWRVWTKCKPVTRSRKEAQLGMNQNIVVENFMQNSASLLLSLKENPSELKLQANKIVDQINQICKQKSNDVALYRKLMDFLQVASTIVHSHDRTITEETIANLFKIQALRSIGN